MPRTVDWAGLRGAPGHGAPEGLRERKKRQTRQQLTDTATEMFLARGFENVSVSEIAAACGVSQKTVFNYFPTKESLVLDQPQATAAALSAGLADPAADPLHTALTVLADELAAVLAWLDAQPARAAAIEQFRRFGALLQTTPALRAYRHDATDQLIALTAAALAARGGLAATDPAPLVAATALLALWTAQFRSLAAHLDAGAPSDRIRDAVTADVRRAAAVVAPGLHALGSRTGRSLDSGDVPGGG